MVKIIAVLIACLALATIAASKPTSNEEAPPLPSENVTDEAQKRPKRHVEGILYSIGGMVGHWIHEIGAHKQQQLDFLRFQQQQRFQQQRFQQQRYEQQRYEQQRYEQQRYEQQPLEQLNQYPPNEAAYIGNGKGNTNHVTYNIYNRNPYYK